MIVLDTNVLSELMRPRPDPGVLAWVDQAASIDLCTTAVTQAEILAGLASMPAGRRRDGLAAGAATLFDQLFRGRILSFDSRAAPEYAEIVAGRIRDGRSHAPLDCQIAAITKASRAILATRNTRDFDEYGFEIINPWTA